MSWYLPRMWLNRGFVALLIVNCWSTALAQVLIPGSETRKRLACLLSDSLLDLVCSVGIPSIMVSSYWTLYDPMENGFAEALWYDDTFLVQVVGELQLVVVPSWLDLLSCVSFAYGLYSSLDNIKELVRPARPKVSHHDTAETSSPAVESKVATISGPDATLVLRGPSEASTKVVAAHRNRAARLQGALFGAWGLLAVIFHLHADHSQTRPTVYSKSARGESLGQHARLSRPTASTPTSQARLTTSLICVHWLWRHADPGAASECDSAKPRAECDHPDLDQYLDWYKWVEDLLFEGNVYYTFYAGGSPYCLEVDEIMAGNRTTLSVTVSANPKAELSNLLKGSTLDEFYVHCGYFTPAFYPYQLEDATYGIQ